MKNRTENIGVNGCLNHHLPPISYVMYYSKEPYNEENKKITENCAWLVRLINVLLKEFVVYLN